MSLLYSQHHVDCSWLGSRILIFLFSSSECSYSVVTLESWQAFPEKSKQKGNARISGSLQISYTKMEIHGKNKRYLCSLWLSIRWISKICCLRNEFYLSVLTALICGFSLDPLIFREYSGYLTYYYNVILSILNLFVSRSTYLFMCALLSVCPKPNNVQPRDKLYLFFFFKCQ